MVIELRLLIQLLPGEPIRHAGIVGDLVDPGFAEREILQVLPDLAGGVGGEAGAPQVIGVVEVLRDLLEVLGPRPVALAGGRDFELGRDARGAREDLLRVPPERGHVPRVDVERLAARVLLDHAVGIAVVFEGGGLARVVDHRLEAAVLVPGHAAVLVAGGGVPAGRVAAAGVEEAQHLAKRPAAALRFAALRGDLDYANQFDKGQATEKLRSRSPGLRRPAHQPPQTPYIEGRSLRCSLRLAAFLQAALYSNALLKICYFTNLAKIARKPFNTAVSGIKIS